MRRKGEGRESIPLVLLAAGRGKRLGEGVRKARVDVGGMSLLALAASNVLPWPELRPIVVVVDPRDLDWARSVLPRTPDFCFTSGGERRQDSVLSGLALVPQDSELVVVHDAARPLFTRDVLDRLFAALQDPAVDGAVPVLPVDDTVRRVDATGRNLGVVDRKELRLVQTPQLFRLAALRRAYDALAASDWVATDDAAAVEEQGGRVVLVEGSRLLHKLTWPEDLASLRALRRSPPQ